MANCIDACIPEITPVVLEGCTPQILSGGYRAFAFMKCNASFSDVSNWTIGDVATWEALVASGDIFFTPKILAQKPESSVTNFRAASCLPEFPISEIQTFTFQDYNADKTNFTHIDFYNAIRNGFGGLKFMAISCEGNVYGPVDEGFWTLSASEVKGATEQEPTYINGVVSVNHLGIIKPVYVPGLVSILP